MFTRIRRGLCGKQREGAWQAGWKVHSTIPLLGVGRWRDRKLLEKDGG